MGNLSGVNDLTAGARAPLIFAKASISTSAIGLWGSSWLALGLPTAGGVPAVGSGQTNDETTPGALSLPALGVNEDAYLSAWDIVSGNPGAFVLCDRLVSTSGLNGTLTTPQAVNSVALPARVLNAEGVECALEWYSPTGTTAASVTVNFTDQNNAARTVTFALPANVGASRFYPITPFLPAGVKGVKSVQPVQLSVSTGTAGNFGVTLFKRVAWNSVGVANTPTSLDFALRPIKVTKMCLFMLGKMNATSTGQIESNLSCSVK
jgi:hypothetical protein